MEERVSKPAPPAGYELRGATWEDLPGVVTMLAETDVHDVGEPDLDESLLRHEWSLPSLDLARDAWLVLTPGGAIAGYGFQHARANHTLLDGWGAVHPEHRGRGIGSLLLDLAEWRAGQHRAAADPGASVRFGVDTTGDDEAVHGMLRARGFALVRHFLRMEIEVDPSTATAAVEVPHGTAIRQFERGRDDRAVHAAIQESFAEHFNWVPRPFDEWAAHRLEAEAFDPTLWWVAQDADEEIVGALIAELTAISGWVDNVGVRKPWRGRGIGEALLRASFGEFGRRGTTKVGLGVDAANETGATRLYERVGMRVARRYDRYERVLSPPRAGDGAARAREEATSNAP